MTNARNSKLKHYLKFAVGMLPALVACFVLYYFEKHQVWIPETPHRDKYTIAILLIGMTASYFLLSHLAKNGKK